LESVSDEISNSKADVLKNYMEDMLNKKNEGQIDLSIGRRDEGAPNDKTECIAGPVAFSEIIDKNRVSAAKLKLEWRWTNQMTLVVG
jgi:hypothetical protein